MHYLYCIGVIPFSQAHSAASSQEINTPEHSTLSLDSHVRYALLTRSSCRRSTLSEPAPSFERVLSKQETENRTELSKILLWWRK